MAKRTEEMNRKMVATRRRNWALKKKLLPVLYKEAAKAPHPEDLPVVMMSNAPRHQEFAEFLVTAWKLYHS